MSTTMRYHHNTHQEIQNKYREYLDSPKTKDIIPQTMSNEQILRILDTKYLNGEIPREIYTNLRDEYKKAQKEHHSTINKSSKTDFAYQ